MPHRRADGSLGKGEEDCEIIRMKSGCKVTGKVAKSLARFIEPMECLSVQKLPAGGNWLYEIKLDGRRLESVKTGGKVMLYSRRGKSLNSQFSDIADALTYLPNETVIDGKVVAIDENSRPNFNLLQNFRSAGANRDSSHLISRPIRRDKPATFGSVTGVRHLPPNMSERRPVLTSVVVLTGLCCLKLLGQSLAQKRREFTLLTQEMEA